MASIRSREEFADYLRQQGIYLPLHPDEGLAEVMCQPLELEERRIGNRFCTLPMEGWDATGDGHPTDLVRRRWERMGRSGAKLIWGGEAAAVAPDGRANPHQLMVSEATVGDLAALREGLMRAHRETFGRDDDLLVGLQLTHSGRFARSSSGPAPRTVYRHPILDSRVGATDACMLSDSDIERIIEQHIGAAVLAAKGGFDFVDVKQCHGYLGHEMLSAVDRPGRFGGSFENRTHYVREIIAGIQAATNVKIGSRISLFDFIPFHAGHGDAGLPQQFEGRYPYAFGGDGTGVGIDLSEPVALVQMLVQMNVRLICATGGSPYYNPHIQRPAMFPPSDGYQPPEDPLVGVARLIHATAQVKRRCPQAIIVGAGYTYLQEWLGPVAAGVVDAGMADFTGMGRMLLPYPDMITDILSHRPLDARRLCRTFSDCTTAPRNGLVSGCYPLDEFYHDRPDGLRLGEIKGKSRRISGRSATDPT
jgi:2,4-dienoyl-CoA reductase-like NADH-dependent reductase (Old Yellow Enzyme family)